MKVLQKLTLANLRQNRRRTTVTIIGVILSSALILAVVGIVASMRQMMINFAIDEVGNYHDMYEEVPAEKLKYLTENQHVESYFYSEPLTEDTLKDGFDAEVLETYEVYQNAPYKAKFYEKLNTLPANNTKPYNVYIRYDEPGKYETFRQQILETLGGSPQINVRTNSDLLRYEAAAMSDVTLASLISLAIIVIAIIVVTSIFVIRNSFSISATERARQFGMLSSVGATPRQIRRSVIFEGAVIGAIGIPLGILLGMLAVVILVAIMNYLMRDMLAFTISVAMPWWIFPIAILLSVITIFLSSLMPAIRAAKMSPIEAIRGNQDIKIKSKKLRTSRFIKHTFGIGGVIADKNLKRSRKKYRTTVISIVLSVATFIGLYSFLGYGQQVVGLQYDNSKIDLTVGGGDAELYQDLATRFNLKDYAYYLRTNVLDVSLYLVNPDYFTKYAEEVGVKAKDLNKVVILDDLTMTADEAGAYKVERAYPDLQPGDELEVEAIKQWHEEKVQDGQGGSFIAKTYGDADKVKVKIPITKITDLRPLGFENSHYETAFASEDYYLRDQLGLDADATSFYAENVEDVKPIIQYLEEVEKTGKYKYLNFQDVEEVKAQSRRIYLLISIFLYGFIAVVTLIGVTNIFNTITTNIALRAKEFAMLKSIGMTTREFNHMVRLESLMYAVKALVIGIPLGLLLSYGFYQSIAQSVDFGYSIPWMAILLSIIAVGALISAIMHYSVKQVEKQNIIETIRNENI